MDTNIFGLEPTHQSASAPRMSWADFLLAEISRNISRKKVVLARKAFPERRRRTRGNSGKGQDPCNGMDGGRGRRKTGRVPARRSSAFSHSRYSTNCDPFGQKQGIGRPGPLGTRRKVFLDRNTPSDSKKTILPSPKFRLHTAPSHVHSCEF